MDLTHIQPTITDLYEKQAWFSKDPAELASDRPARGVQEVIDFWTPRVERALYEYSVAQAAFSVAESQVEAATEDNYEIWQEASGRAFLLCIRLQQKLHQYRETRGKFWWELAYVCHYEEIMRDLSFQQLEEAKAWLRPLMPAAITAANKERIYKSLRRKIYRALLQGRRKLPRRLIRGLPLVTVGIC